MDTFTRFLQGNAVFSQTQADKMSQALQDCDDENKAIFQLADFFRSLTPSDCYDLAFRLFSLWKTPLKTPAKKRQSPEKSPSMAEQKMKPDILNVGSASPNGNLTTSRFRSFSPSQADVKSLKESNSIQNSELFSFLHNEAQRKNYTKLQNEQKRVQNEMTGCTFRPKTTKSPLTQHNKGSEEVFKRLKQDLRRDKQEINQTIKSEIEMKGCTFKPQINRSSIRSAFMDAEREDSQSSSRLNRTFDRLYKDHHSKRHLSIENELRRQKQEVDGCTFQPLLTSRASGSQGDIANRHDKLHQLHAERERSLMNKRIEQSEKEAQKCSFQPQLVASPAGRPSNKDIHQRLFEWNELKKRKIDLKLQEKLDETRNQELDLPTRRRNEKVDLDTSGSGQAYQRLYQDSAHKKVRKEILEKRILKDIGASFTPNTNIQRHSGNKSARDGNMASYFSFPEAGNLGTSRDNESNRNMTPKSPPPQYFSRRMTDKDIMKDEVEFRQVSSGVRSNYTPPAHEQKTVTFGLNY